MQIELRPVYVVGGAWPLLPQPDGQLEVITDQAATDSRIEALGAYLREGLKGDATLLEPVVLRRSSDIARLRESALSADALLVYVMGLMPLEKLLEIGLPIIAFSGQYTPMMGLYALPVEMREHYSNLTYALDLQEIRDQVRLLLVKKRLGNTRMVLVGGPLTMDGHWEHLPDQEMVTRRLGAEVIAVSAAEFVAEVGRVEKEKAEAVAREWMSKAEAVAEPSESEIMQVAEVYLALHRVLKRTRAQAVAVGCLELMYICNLVPHCFALATLRDEGIPAACEADVSALLTMVILGYLGNKPAYMGNVVRADPKENLVMISHGCSPAKMAGLDQPPKPYTLVQSHSAPPFSRVLEGGSGVTSYVDYMEDGQVATIARIARDLDRIVAARAEIVGCRDTICDRTTLDLHVRDAREFFHQATGNHHVVVYGDYLDDLQGLCRLLDMRLVEV